MNNLLKRAIVVLFPILILSTGQIYSQEDSTVTNVYEGLSLRDLLNVKIVSVSKNSERLFDAPLSASVLTRDEIKKSGATSIMEALRLVPGMIIREQSNGNYDIYLRGMDNVPPNSSFQGSSTTTLVMVNSHPIYNYLKGGTFWETLPVDLNDVERIEVVRGPAAALYGPNAVSGVINIITREVEKEGLYMNASSRQGSFGTFINNASFGYRFNHKLSVIVSGNYQLRQRTQTSYYEIFRNEWLTDQQYMINILGDTVKDMEKVYPDPKIAMKKYAGNIFVNYDVAEKISLQVAAGSQHSFVQRVSTENGITPLTTVVSDSRYADLRARVYGFSAQFAFNDGVQVVDHQPGNKYDFNTFDGRLDYDFHIRNLSIKPGISYRRAIYDDTRYSDTVNRTGIFNARGVLTTASASLHGEYKMLNNKLRLVAGIMANKFNYPDTTYMSHELAVTYNISKKHIVRAVYSLAPRSSNVYDNYINQQAGFFPVGPHKYISVSIESNKQLKLLTARMFEIGYRGKLSNKISLDLELFDTHAKNFTSVVTNASYTSLQGEDTLHVTPYSTSNLPATWSQQGVTVSLSYNTHKLSVRPFVTLQHSLIKDYSTFMNTADADPSLANNNPVDKNFNSGIGTETPVKSTPNIFGGASINYIPALRWNLNVNVYGYSTQTYYHISNLAFNDGIRGIDKTKAKGIINMQISYEPVKKVILSLSGKNILDNHSREFFRTDDVPFMLIGGINYEF